MLYKKTNRLYYRIIKQFENIEHCAEFLDGTVGVMREAIDEDDFEAVDDMFQNAIKSILDKNGIALNNHLVAFYQLLIDLCIIFEDDDEFDTAAYEDLLLYKQQYELLFQMLKF